MPDTNALFGEEEITAGGGMGYDSTTSTPRASVQEKVTKMTTQPPPPPQSPPRQKSANVYENTPVSPSALPVDAASVSPPR